jgi:predicted nucleic acid-binding protein
MILADTSVIIDIWRNLDKKKQEIFERNEIATCYVIRAELFHGARSDKEKKKIEDALNELNLLPINDEVWEYLGEILYKLKKQGLTVPFQDALIVSVCIKHNCQLWTQDKHFSKMGEILNELNLFQPVEEDLEGDISDSPTEKFDENEQPEEGFDNENGDAAAK